MCLRYLTKRLKRGVSRIIAPNVEALAREGLEALPLSLCRTPKESTKVEFININPSLANAMLCEVHLRD